MSFPTHFRGLLVSSRILVFVSNVKRLYSQWSYRVLNLPILSKGESYTTSNPVERTVSRRKTSARTPKLEVNIFLKCRASYLLKLIMHSFQVFYGCLCFVSNPCLPASENSHCILVISLCYPFCSHPSSHGSSPTCGAR